MLVSSILPARRAPMSARRKIEHPSRGGVRRNKLVTKVIAIWHRLTTPRPLSPALETFLAELAKTPDVWQVEPNGKLRAHQGGDPMCVITGVTLYRTDQSYGIDDWIHAADSIGLSYTEAGLIVAAADNPVMSGFVKILRGRLLDAARIRSAPVVATIGHQSNAPNAPSISPASLARHREAPRRSIDASCPRQGRSSLRAGHDARSGEKEPSHDIRQDSGKQLLAS